MNDAAALTEALRALLLPIDPDREEMAEAAASAHLTTAGHDPADHAAVLRYELSRWRDANAPSALLRDVVGQALANGDPNRGAAIAARYFDLHGTLSTDFLLSFEEARGLLSHLRLALHLIEQERMSCAQVARVIQARRRSAEHTWQQIHEMCRTFASMPNLDLGKVEALTETDVEDGVSRFADATDEDEISLIADIGTDLGFPGDIRSTLKAFVDPEPLGSLLIILHFASAVAEYYDHPLSATYELSPRGAVAGFLKEQHPSYTASENPFLNLAKGASAFDLAWVWGRDRAIRSRADALVGLLVGLESMGFSARRELAACVRQWLVRVERRQAAGLTPLPGVTSMPEVEALLSAVAVGNTRTHGILEQRVVDALCELIHPTSDGWFARGVGDSVNASNLGRRKVGDCEFERPEHSKIQAYEAHGGKLAEVYVAGHLRSLGAVLRSRRDDLAAIAPPDEWDIGVTFVAHDNGVLADRQELIGEFNVSIEFIDYATLNVRARDAVADRGEPESTLIGQTNARVVGPINEPWTPQQVRDRVAGMLALPDWPSEANTE
jgi:hypothetical protein